MLKNMLNKIGRWFKFLGMGITWIPLLSIKYCGDAIREDKAGKLIFAVVGFPFGIAGGAIIAAYCIAGAILLAAGTLLFIPIAATIDCIKALKKCFTREDATPNETSVPAPDIENPTKTGDQSQTIINAALSQNTASADSLDKYSSYTQAYIDSFKNTMLHSETIKNMKLSEEEEKKLEECLDPIMKKVMDIAVQLNEKTYNLDTLEKILGRDAKDPFTKFPFKRRDIQPDREANNRILQILEKIEKQRDIRKSAQMSDQPAMKLTPGK